MQAYSRILVGQQSATCRRAICSFANCLRETHRHQCCKTTGRLPATAIPTRLHSLMDCPFQHWLLSRRPPPAAPSRRIIQVDDFTMLINGVPTASVVFFSDGHAECGRCWKWAQVGWGRCDYMPVYTGYRRKWCKLHVRAFRLSQGASCSDGGAVTASRYRRADALMETIVPLAKDHLRAFSSRPTLARCLPFYCLFVKLICMQRPPLVIAGRKV